MNSEKHCWAISKQRQRKLNRKNLDYLGILRKPRWRQVLKAEGLKDNPFAEYYHQVNLNANMLRLARSFKRIGLNKVNLKGGD